MGGYRQIKCIDRAGFNIEAFRMVIPDDWTCYGGITWVNDIHMPVYSNFAVVSPDGLRAVEGFPVHKYMWNTDPFARMHLKTWETPSTKVHEPVEADQAIVDTILPAYRGRVQGVRITGRGPLPPTEPMLYDPANPPRTPVRFGKVRITYTVGEAVIEEEIYGGLEVIQVPGTGMVICTLSAFGVRAREGELDANMNLFRMMKSSIRLNPAWLQQVEQTMTGLYQQQTQRIQQIGAFSRRWSQMADQVMEARTRSWQESSRAFDALQESYRAASAAQDRAADEFSQAIRGVETYYDPYQERTVELEGGHVAAWTNALGERILTDSYGYNPNEHLTGNWTRMDPV
ncbi:MAG TPA: hypothetical protein PK089_06860 [Methanoregulaceae archaeon]|nr:hypothetical protein [Methanoregulaceae archaeon]HQJ88955.1 hypothetical protein [Methanoregulaceae archaeon]